MNTNEEEFLKRLQTMFQVEAAEHIKILSSGLIELEHNPANAKSIELIETIFREAHSLKGAARSVDRGDIESICQVLESTFAKVKNEKFPLTVNHFDTIHKAIDAISIMISGNGKTTSTDCRELLKQLRSITETYQPAKEKEEQTISIHTQTEEEPLPAIPENRATEPSDLIEEQLIKQETVRIATAKLDPLFLQAEQMIQSKVASAQRIIDLRNVFDFIGIWKSELRKLDGRSAVSGLSLKEIVGRTGEKLEEAERNLAMVIHDIESDQRSLGRMIDDHVESMKKVLMLPLSTIVEGFPRVVRDLARSQDKDVELIIHGNEIEVDKRILEEIKDPLVHLIRNCVDHGIEKAKERLLAKKTLHGTITLTFLVVDGHNLEAIISDDGAGIDVESVVSASIKAGLISKTEAQQLEWQESLNLVFKSGITTSPLITDISGRGLGLAIVCEKIGKLGGTVSVESQVNGGTTFHLLLPLSLSTSRGVLVRCDEHLFFLPTADVERVVRISDEEIKTVENKATIPLDQGIVGIVNLGDVLGLKNYGKSPTTQKRNVGVSSSFMQIVVLSQGNKRIGFKVDEILDEHQILVKKLGKQLSRVYNISGASVLGSGKVVPVINVTDLMKSAIGTAGIVKQSNEKEAEVTKRFKILVIDDSITSRSLIKNIVESAGYIVETAVDGVDALTKALVDKFDLIVSDVDMPRMNGFELTAKIRKDKRLSEIPVVLVTALESREDREHGIDVGANAYIVKSSFDQSNLLEVIKKLI